jgi:glycosyltransferase involved in cell wall biosynthesis
MVENPPNSPKASVVVPVYNEPTGIRTTLNSLLEQRADNFEILAVNNDSTDETGEVISEIAASHSDTVKMFEETDIQSSYAARNTGIENASGEFLLFLDADMWVPETWVEDLVTTLESRECDYLGFNIEVVANKDPGFWEQYEQSFSFPVESYLEHKHFAPTCALAVKREVFDDLGLFDERLESGGDKEFGQRVHRSGFKQCYADDVTAFHPARDSWAELKSKALRIGRGGAQIRRYHSEVDSYNHPLHLVNFLPPSPLRLKRRFADYNASVLEFIGFYLLEYVLKIIQTYGTIRESLALRRSDFEDP